MRVILDMASGENLTEEPGHARASMQNSHRIEAEWTLPAPETRLELVESVAISRSTTSLAGIDFQALIRAIED